MPLNNFLEELWDLRDKRVDDWPLMNSPLPTVALCCAYFYFVKFLGPRLMKERKAWEIRNTIIVYNCIQVKYKGVPLSLKSIIG